MTKKEKRTLHGCGLARQSVEKLKSNSTQKIHLERSLEQFSIQYNLNLVLDKVYQEKKSGRKTKYHLRDDFHELERKVANQEIGFVIFENVQRMGRWDIKNKEFVQLCHEKGVIVSLVDHGKLDLRKRADRIKFGIDSMFAEEGSNEISEKVSTKGRTNAVMYGKDKNTTPTLGLAAHPTYTGQYVPEPKGIEIINEMIEKFIETEDYLHTAEFLNEKGYRTPVRWTQGGVNDKGERVPSKKIGGKEFTSTSVKNYLSCKKLRGWNEFVDDYDQFPELQDENGVVRWEYGYARESESIISKEKGEIIDLIMSRRKHKSKKEPKYLLSDTMETPSGIKYRGTAGTSKTGKYHHYYEVPKRHREEGVTYRNLSGEELEKTVLSRASEYLENSGLLSEIIAKFTNNRHLGVAPVKEQILQLEHKVKELSGKVNKYTQKIEILILAEGMDKESIKTLTAMKAKAESELGVKAKELKETKARVHQICNTDREEAFKKTLRSVLRIFKTSELAKQRELLQMVFPRIVFYPEGRLHLDLNLALQPLHMEKKGSSSVKKWLGWRDSNPRPKD